MTSSTKICFLGFENLPVLAREYNRHPIGGEQVQQTLLAKALARRGYAVSMVVRDYGQPEGALWEGVKVYKAYRLDEGFPILRFVHPRWSKTWRALRRADADIYYTSCAGMHVGLLALFCRLHARGFVYRLASDADASPHTVKIKYRRDRALYGYGLRSAGVVLAQHDGQRRELENGYGVSSQPAAMLVESPEKLMSYEGRDIPLLWVSNIRHLKRVDRCLELARRRPDVGVHIVGGPAPGFQNLYESAKVNAEQQENVTFHGAVPYHDVGAFYDRARILVNTSDIEGFPNSYLQAWRRGVPVVAFFDPDGLIVREGLGYIVQTDDEMAAAVDKLLYDREEWECVSERCRSFMATHYNDSQVLADYERAFVAASRGDGCGQKSG
jgi:glycosyltransferase involved in cell wall biosynthesis